jgi:hypothetical protein
MEAKEKAKEVLRETDEKAEDAEKMVDDLKAVTEGLEGVLEGGISEEDNNELENIVRQARDVADDQYRTIDEKRRDLIDVAGEWQDHFQKAVHRKQVDQRKLDQTLQRLTSDHVKKLVKQAVDSSEREAETYDDMQRDTDEEKKADERHRGIQQRAADIAKSINVKVG